jgi:hypothetical protein
MGKEKKEVESLRKLMDVDEQMSVSSILLLLLFFQFVFIVYTQSSPKSVKMAQKKRRGKASRITVTKFS